MKTDVIMENNNKVSKAAADYCNAGLSVIPCDRLRKYPTIKSWKEFQLNPPSIDQVNTWFKNSTCNALGILMGHGYETIDFDARGKEFHSWKSMVIAEKPALFERLLVEKTQNDGFHVTYKCEDIQQIGSVKLATEANPVDKEGEYTFYKKTIKSREYDGKHLCVITSIETRGQGGMIICTPTPGYELIQGDFTRIATITKEERDFLIETARSFNSWIEPAKVSNSHPAMNGGNGSSPAEQYNQRGDIKPVLVKHGAVELANGHWRRPGKISGPSATLLDDKVFYVFSSNWPPFDPDTGYSKFAVYALLEHDGDFSQAAHALIAEGYGEPFKRTRPAGNDTFWDVATERFPRRPFPWEAFPSSITESLKQAARSCATSDVAMPGAAMAIMASALGRAVITSPKKSWEEPMIFWVADIRSSGQGKTPSVHMLLNPIYQAQKRTDDNYQAEFDRWLSLPKKSRGAPPNRARGHFVTDLTLEGLRMEVQTGHGGLICVMDELSSIISAQNQYKLKGNDRESWLALWDGHDARISRVSKSTTIRGCRISIIGGLQPVVFGMAFCGDGGIYLNDGTLFRFLFTYVRDAFVPLTNESWSDENRKVWELTLANAMTWADGITSVDGWTPHVLRFSNDAREFFLSYRNNLVKGTKQLPTPIQGFIPKAISYVLRISGLLHCMFQFTNQTQPGDTLDVEDIKQSISVVEFYLANAVSAMQLIEDRSDTRAIDKTTVTLVSTLERLRDELDSGRLAVGYIHKTFNDQCDPLLKVKSEKAMGALLREHGLTISPGKHDANSRRGVYCLTWDKKADDFVRTLQTSINQSPHEETQADTGSTDIADIVSGEKYEIEGNIL